MVIPVFAKAIWNKKDPPVTAGLLFNRRGVRHHRSGAADLIPGLSRLKITNCGQMSRTREEG
jgi:hypothetical protein